MAAPALTIDINARLASLEQGLAQANRQLGSFNDKVSTTAQILKGAFAGFTIGSVTRQVVGAVKAVIDYNDRLGDLSKSSGVAVATLGGLGFAAEQSGSSLDGIAKAFKALDIQIAAAATGNAKALEPFDKIGIKLEELRTLRPEQIFTRIADAFSTYADGPNKAALGNAIFKRSYDAIIPLLDEGGAKIAENTAYFERYGGVNDDVVRRSDEFNDTLTKLKLLSGAFARTLTADLLPGLQGIADEMVRAKEKGEGFSPVAKEVADVTKTLAHWASIAALGYYELGRSIGVTLAQMNLVAHGDFGGARKLGQEFQNELTERGKALQALVDKANGAAGSGAYDPRLDPNAPNRKRDAPGLANRAGGHDDPTKRILEGDLKEIQAYVDQERNVLKARSEYLGVYFQEGYLSIASYYQQKHDAQRDDLAVTVKGYDDEIAAIRAYIAKAPKQTDRAEGENKIIDLTRKRTTAIQEAAKVDGLSYFEESRALREYQNSVKELSASVLELQGNTVAAARIRTSVQNEGLRRSFTANNDTAALGQLDELERRLDIQARLNDATKKYGILTESLGLAQQRVNIDLQSGRITEIDSLTQRSELNRAMIPLLEAQAAAYERIAQASGDPTAILNAQRLRVEIYGLSQETDLLADKFNGVFKDAFSSAIESFANGSKSLKDILKDLEKSIGGALSKIAADNISQSLFGKEGPLSGAGGFLSSLFGGKGGAASGATGTAALTGAGTVLTSAGTLLTTAAASLQAAASALAFGGSGAGGIANGLGGFFSSGGSGGLAGWTSGFDIGGFAEGGNPPVGKASLVGERGMELFVPKVQGTIIPNHALRGMGGNRTTNINISVPAGTSRQSSQQIGAEVGRQLQRIMRRNS